MDRQERGLVVPTRRVNFTMKVASGGVDKSMCPTGRDWPKPRSSRVLVSHVLQPTRRDPHSRILLAIPGATSVDCF